MSDDGASTPDGVLDQFRQAWNAGDAVAFGQLFTEDATYVIFRGDVMVGREAIQQAHHEVFTRWQPGTQLIVKRLHARQLDAHTVVLLTIGGIGSGAIEFDKFQTVTLVRREGRWLIAAFQNTEMSEQSRQRYAPG
ncbi:MAG: SgcJ/EcaC family oxidoreductase [Chloroflexi bacterium]|nr:SgcJ/EcaC family oxidoreductase [Chloroflexota bacterium]